MLMLLALCPSYYLFIALSWRKTKVLIDIIAKTYLSHLSKHKFSLSLAKRSPKKISEHGLTIIESLVAVVVASVVVAAITPPILVAVATRVQNQRAEQAFQLAQAEVDKARLMLERGDYEITDLPPVSTSSSVGDTPALQTYVTDSSQVTATQGLAVDVNTDGINDFVIQVFRTAGSSISEDDKRPITFEMGVRVYSFVAFEGSTKPTLEKIPASLTFTSGDGSQRRRPLSVLYTRLTRSDINESFEKYRDSLN